MERVRDIEYRLVDLEQRVNELEHRCLADSMRATGGNKVGCSGIGKLQRRVVAFVQV